MSVVKDAQGLLITVAILVGIVFLWGKLSSLFDKTDEKKPTGPIPTKDPNSVAAALNPVLAWGSQQDMDGFLQQLQNFFTGTSPAPPAETSVADPSQVVANYADIPQPGQTTTQGQPDQSDPFYAFNDPYAGPNQ